MPSHTRHSFHSHPLPPPSQIRRLRRIRRGCDSGRIRSASWTRPRYAVARRSYAIRNDRSRIPFASGRLPHPSRRTDERSQQLPPLNNRLRFSELNYLIIINIPKSIRYTENPTNHCRAPPRQYFGTRPLPTTASTVECGPRRLNVFRAVPRAAILHVRRRPQTTGRYYTLSLVHAVWGFLLVNRHMRYCYIVYNKYPYSMFVDTRQSYAVNRNAVPVVSSC